MAKNTKTPIMVLQELTVKNGYSPPDYIIVFQKAGTHKNRFDYEVSVAGIRAQGSGSSKQIARHQAAHNALIQLQEIGIYNPLENPVVAFDVPLEVPLKDDNSNSTYKSALNCIVDLQNICMENKLNAPEFVEVSSVGPPHSREFTYECKISSITTEARASTKKMAKQLAANAMLDRIKEVIPDLVLEQKDLHTKLTDENSEALAKYQELREIIPDKTIKIDEIPNTLAKLMSFKNLTYEDFKEDLKSPTEESLKNILNKLEVKYSLETFQEQPPMAVLNFRIDTPFTMLGLGKNFEDAAQSALKQAFMIMDNYMQIKLEKFE